MEISPASLCDRGYTAGMWAEMGPRSPGLCRGAGRWPASPSLKADRRHTAGGHVDWSPKALEEVATTGDLMSPTLSGAHHPQNPRLCLDGVELIPRLDTPDSKASRTWAEKYRVHNPHLATALTPSHTVDFTDSAEPVDEAKPSPCQEWSASRQWAFRVLSARHFVLLIHVSIILNTVTVALDQSSRVAEREVPLLNAIEHGFIALFLLELLLRFYAERSKAVANGWFWFDMFLVAMAVAANWVVPSFGLISNTGKPHSALGVALVLRAARLARVARALRLVRQLSHLWSLVHALLTSTRMIGYVFVVVALVLHVFNSIALELITLRYINQPDVPEHIREIVENSFQSMGSSMLTLVQFLCFDSIAAVYRPLAQYDWVLAIFFMLVVMVVGIVLMNVITATIVNNALKQSDEDKEFEKEKGRRRKEELVESLYNAFLRLDTSKTGELSLEGLQSIRGDDATHLAEFSGQADPIDVFRMLDIDRCGHMPIYEYCEGLYEVVVGEPRVELRNIMRHVHRISDHLLANGEALARIEAAVRQALPSHKLAVHSEDEKPAMGDRRAECARMDELVKIPATPVRDGEGIDEFREGLYKEAVGQSAVQQRDLAAQVHRIADVLISHGNKFAQMQADMQRVLFAMGQEDCISQAVRSSDGNSSGQIAASAPAVDFGAHTLSCSGTQTLEPGQVTLSCGIVQTFSKKAPAARRSADTPPSSVTVVGSSAFFARAESGGPVEVDAKAAPAVRAPTDSRQAKLSVATVASRGGCPRSDSFQPLEDGNSRWECAGGAGSTEERSPSSTDAVHRRVFEWL